MTGSGCPRKRGAVPRLLLLIFLVWSGFTVLAWLRVETVGRRVGEIEAWRHEHHDDALIERESRREEIELRRRTVESLGREVLVGRDREILADRIDELADRIEVIERRLDRLESRE